MGPDGILARLNRSATAICLLVGLGPGSGCRESDAGRRGPALTEFARAGTSRS